MKQENNYKKLFITYIAITFGVCWGVCLLYVIFHDAMASVFGEMTLSNPLINIALNMPGIAGIFIYFLYDRTRGLKNYLKTLVPRKKDLIWFPVIIVVMTLYIFAVRYVCILFHIDVPEMTYSPAKMFKIFLGNFIGETGMIGQCCGWFGFLLPYFQKKYRNGVKAGLLTGFWFALFLAPGYVFSSFETATAYPSYVAQMMLLSVCISYVLNETGGNVLFFLLAFWIAATGSKIKLYYFLPKTQLVQIGLFIVLFAIMYVVFNKRNAGKEPEEYLQMFPEFIEKDAR